MYMYVYIYIYQILSFIFNLDLWTSIVLNFKIEILRKFESFIKGSRICFNVYKIPVILTTEQSIDS